MLKNSTAAPDRTSQRQISEKLVSAGFHALSDPLRIQILELLREQELCVCELCDRLSVPQPKLSFHLKTLKDAALVRSRQEGRWIYYSLNLAQFVALEQYLAEYRRFSQILPARPCSDAG
ncbi:metalloregulator ArsR/SmtB family transcription factor [Microcoleus sp. A003_D6]|uniref:ArsR/SmtB family transcription factor n=1 Tax=Microcoleus sp. A003_D6 TaxID=3055266 RepID=UPI002FCF3AF4